VTALVNGHAGIEPDPLASLAGRLTDPQDRERYAALISYTRALPPTDEFRQLVDLLGLLSLLGQRVPTATAELLVELREQAQAAAGYHAQVNERLANLPQEIAQGVDAAAIAKAMSESFRQQITSSGLQETSMLLNLSVKDIKALAANFTSALRPVLQEYKGISGTVSAELTKLLAASREVQNHNARLMVQERSKAWVWQGLLALVLFLAGGLCGIVVEKRQTQAMLSGIVVQMDAIRTPPAPLVPSGTRPSHKAQSR